MRIEFRHSGTVLWSYTSLTPVLVPRVGDIVTAWGDIKEDINLGSWRVTQVTWGYYSVHREDVTCDKCVVLVCVEPRD
jgi:hypothetical protein